MPGEKRLSIELYDTSETGTSGTYIVKHSHRNIVIELGEKAVETVDGGMWKFARSYYLIAFCFSAPLERTNGPVKLVPTGSRRQRGYEDIYRILPVDSCQLLPIVCVDVLLPPTSEVTWFASKLKLIQTINVPG